MSMVASEDALPLTQSQLEQTTQPRLTTSESELAYMYERPVQVANAQTLNNVITPGCAAGNTWTAVMVSDYFSIVISTIFDFIIIIIMYLFLIVFIYKLFCVCLFFLFLSLALQVRGTGTRPECNQYPTYRQVSFQSIDAAVLAIFRTKLCKKLNLLFQVAGTGPIITMAASVNDNNPSTQGGQYACTSNQVWEASVYGGGRMIFKPSMTQPTAYAKCTSGPHFSIYCIVYHDIYKYIHFSRYCIVYH
jgi:hypothetical protein